MHEILDLAVSAARDAGAELLRRFRGPLRDVATKTSSTDVVTEADHAADEIVRARIHAARPRDAVLTEESGERAGETGLRWIVDPLDGTVNFLFGVPQWAVSIACEDEDGRIAGVIHDPVRDETFAALRGDGATLNGAPIRVSERDDLARALVGTGFSYRAEERAVAAAMLTRIITRVRDVRRAGAATLDLAWLAAGRLDGFYEVPLQRWDWAAGRLIAEEAGARAATLDAVGASGPGIVAANAALFEPLRALVEDARSAALSG